MILGECQAGRGGRAPVRAPGGWRSPLLLTGRTRRLSALLRWRGVGRGPSSVDLGPPKPGFPRLHVRITLEGMCVLPGPRSGGEEVRMARISPPHPPWDVAHWQSHPLALRSSAGRDCGKWPGTCRVPPSSQRVSQDSPRGPPHTVQVAGTWAADEGLLTPRTACHPPSGKFRVISCRR